MNKKKKMMAITILFCILSIVLLGGIEMLDNLRVNVTETQTSSKITSYASWVSSAVTINEVAKESDLIVKVRVLGEPKSRTVRNEIPVWNENNEIVSSKIVATIFSDTTVEIIKTYYGISRETIEVAQTGGFDPAVAKNVIELMDDPLYKTGEEYILFLVNISGDPIHAPDRELYRIVNPFGRYSIQGESAHSYGENFGQDTLPTDLSIIELELQIEEAIKSLTIPAETITPTP